MTEKVKKSIFKRWWFWVIAVVVFLCVIANLGNKADKTVSSSVASDSSLVVNKETKPKVEPKKEEKVIVVKAEALAKQFDENEIKGNQLYKDKMIEVTGKVDSVGEALGQTYVVLSSGEEYAITNVQCYFESDDQIAKVADIKKGDSVTIIGNVDGKSINVSVNDCKFK